MRAFCINDNQKKKTKSEQKTMNRTSFQGLENQKTLEKVFGTMKKKKKFKEIQRLDRQID